MRVNLNNLTKTQKSKEICVLFSLWAIKNDKPDRKSFRLFLFSLKHFGNHFFKRSKLYLGGGVLTVSKARQCLKPV